MTSNNRQIGILKSDGTREPFIAEKLAHSLRRAGAPDDAVDDILEAIEGELHEGMTTAHIYDKAFRLLKAHEQSAASRYSLRRALFALGPTGYPFEDYIAALFAAKGYEAKSRIMVEGKCTVHELDVIAEKKGARIGAELKYHNTPGVKTDLKVVLYVKARFDDIEDRHRMAPSGKTLRFDEAWVVTNTKFTLQAIEYASCAGLTLVGWNYPSEGNLQQLIEETNLHPVTCLTSLSSAHKRKLTEEGIVLCRSIPSHVDVLRGLGMTNRAIQSTLSEASRLCGT